MSEQLLDIRHDVSGLSNPLKLSLRKHLVTSLNSVYSPMSTVMILILKLSSKNLTKTYRM